MSPISALAGALLLVASAAQAPHDAILSDLAEARSAGAVAGDQLWPGFNSAPYGLLFVHEAGETLIGDARTPDGFIRSGSGSDNVATGPRSWRNPALLAAMPVFGPPSVIVMGSPATTGRSRRNWQLTVLHEHFHQWQTALPGYYDRVAALGLDNGDSTGMWMLNYPFPYAAARQRYGEAARLLHAAITARTVTEQRAAAARYLNARQSLQASVSAAEWRYFDFQLWQEGVARWTEIALGSRSRNRPLIAEASMMRRTVLQALTTLDAAPPAREIAYPLGAGEAMLLDMIDADWRGCYRVSLGLTECWNSMSLGASTP